MKKWKIAGTVSIASLASAAYYFAGVMLAINPDGPPAENARENLREVPVSTVFVPIDLPLDLVENVVMDAVGGKTLASGKSTDMIGTAFSSALKLPPPKRVCRTQVVTETVQRQVQCKDFTRGRDFLDGAGRFFECIGRAASTLIVVPVEVVKEITKCDPVKTVAEAVAPIPELRYAASLRGMDLKVSGSRVTARATANLRLNVGFVGEMFDQLIPLEKSSCDLPVVVTTDADTRVSVANRQLRMQVSLGNFAFDLKTGRCNGIFAGDLDAGVIEDSIRGPIETALTGAIRDAMQSALDDTLRDPLAPGQISDALKSVDQLLTTPIPVVKDPLVSLVLNPELLVHSSRISMGAGGPDILRIEAGMQARPELVALTKPAVPSIKTVDIKTVSSAPRGFSVVPAAHIPLKQVSDKASAVLRDYITQRAPALLPETLRIEAYQSGARVVLGVKAEGISWLNVSAEIFLTAEPGFDPETNEVFLSNIKVDAASSEALVTRAAWFLEGPIEHLLETNLRFSADQTFRQVIASLSDFTYAHPVGRVRINLDKLAMQDFWVDDNVLKIAVQASGTADVQTSLTRLPKQ